MSRRKKESSKKISSRDVGDAVAEIAQETILERIAQALPNMLQPFLSVGLDNLVQHAVGVVSPRIGTLILATKAARAERNFDAFSRQIKDLTQEVTNIRVKLDDPTWLRRAQYILEYSIEEVIDEIDPGKLVYFATGTVNAFLEQQLDHIRHQYFLNLLKQCSTVDIKILRDSVDPNKSALMGDNVGKQPWMEQYGLNEETVQLSMHALQRLGLLQDSTVRTSPTTTWEALATSVRWNAPTPMGRSFVAYFTELTTDNESFM